MVNMTSALNAYNNQLKMGAGSNPLEGAQEKTGPSFSDFLQGQIQDVVSAQNTAETAKMNAVSGKGDITDLVTSIANAELALNTIVTIRDKVISAYQDIIRMPM